MSTCVLLQPADRAQINAEIDNPSSVFMDADEVVLCPDKDFAVADLYRVWREKLCNVRLYLSRSCAEAKEHAFNSMTGNDTVMFFHAGGVEKLPPRDDGWQPKPKRRIWIGQGSNTWKSDLNLSVEYVRTKGRADIPGASLKIPWMAGIPGTVGGWIKMNAGAFGHSISEVIEQVKVDGRWMDNASCGFGYRHSGITGEIQDFRMAQTAYENALADREDYLSRRRKFPSGTYGSFFKNPVSSAASPRLTTLQATGEATRRSLPTAGQLLDAAGAKSLRVGGAFVWDEHANVIVRGAGATASDVLALAWLMRRAVFDRFGIVLEPEVCGIP